MRATLLLCLLLTLFLPQTISAQQTAPEKTVALVFRDPVERVVLIPESQARTEYSELSKKTLLSEGERYRFDALVSALQTLGPPLALTPNNTREFWQNEVKRGVRRPAQADNYFPKEKP